MRKYSLLVLFLLVVFGFDSEAQRFRYGLNAGTTSVKYWFPVQSDRYHGSKIQPLNASTVGATISFVISEHARITSGLKYVDISGESEGGHIQSLKENGTGDVNFKVNNQFLIIPAEFQILITKKKIRPVIAGGFNVFSPLKEEMTLEVTPDNYNPFYERVGTTITKESDGRYFGALLGAGVLFKVRDRHELLLMIYQRMNNSVYENSDEWNGKFEKHQIRFNMLELNVGYTFR